MKRILNLLLIAIIIVSLLAACASPGAEPTDAPMEEPAVEEVESPEKGPQVGGILKVMISDNPDTLDAQNTYSGPASSVLQRIGASLIIRDPETGLVPYLATDWEVSEDGLTYSFHLKEGVKFHDGTDFTAEDVVWSIERAKSPDVDGAAGSSLGSVESIEAVDDYTVEILLSEPNFPFLENLADPAFLQILSKESVEEQGENYGRNPVGLGPFIFKEWQTDVKIVLERNPDFNWGPDIWHQGPSYIESIEFNIIKEGSTQIAAFLAGDIDYGYVNLINEVPSIEATEEFNLFRFTWAGADPVLVINTARAPMDNRSVREALNTAVNRQALVDVAVQGNGTPQYGPLSSSVIGYWPEIESMGYRYDADQTQALLEEAGYTLNDEGIYELDGELLEFELLSEPREDQIKIAQVLQEQYKAAGIQINITQMDFGSFVGDALEGNFDMMILGAGWNEADLLYMLFHSSMLGALNFSQVNDPELDEILENTRTTVDPEARQNWVNDAQKMIVEKAYWVPLYSTFRYIALSKQVEGATLAQFDLYLHDAYFVEP